MVSVAPKCSNFPAKALASRCCVAMKDNLHKFTKALQAIHMPATEFFLPLLLPCDPFYPVVHPLLKAKVEAHEIEFLSVKHARLSIVTCPVALLSQSIYITLPLYYLPFRLTRGR